MDYYYNVIYMSAMGCPLSAYNRQSVTYSETTGFMGLHNEHNGHWRFQAALLPAFDDIPVHIVMLCALAGFNCPRCSVEDRTSDRSGGRCRLRRGGGRVVINHGRPANRARRAQGENYVPRGVSLTSHLVFKTTSHSKIQRSADSAETALSSAPIDSLTLAILLFQPFQ